MRDVCITPAHQPAPNLSSPRACTPEYTEPYSSPFSTPTHHHVHEADRRPANHSQFLPPAAKSTWRSHHQPPSPPRQEITYRRPKPSIPDFTRDGSWQFTRLKIALDNVLPADITERFKFQILVDHLKLELEDALLIADSYSNSKYNYSDTMASLTEQYGQPHKLALQRIA